MGLTTHFAILDELVSPDPVTRSVSEGGRFQQLRFPRRWERPPSLTLRVTGWRCNVRLVLTTMSFVTRFRAIRSIIASALVGFALLGCGGNAPPPPPVFKVVPNDVTDGEATKRGSAKGTIEPAKPSAEETAKMQLVAEAEAGKKLQALGAAVQLDDKGQVVLVNLLNHPRCDDAALEAIKSLPHLVGLDLRGTKITDAGMVAVGEATSLEELYLGDTSITDKGLEPLLRLGSLKVLNLVNTKITDAGLTKLIGQLKQLTTLNLFKTSVTDAGLKSLKGLEELEVLVLPRSATDESMAVAAERPKLRVLWAIEAQVTDAGMSKFAGHSVLRELDVSQTAVTLDGVLTFGQQRREVAIASPKGIWAADVLTLNPSATEEDLAVLAKHSQLTAIVLQATQVPDKALEPLRGLSQLNSISLPPTTTDAALDMLRGLSKLTNLTLAGAAITNEGAKKLEPHTGLKTLSMMRTRLTDPATDSLGKLTELNSLWLDQTGVGDAGLKSLKTLTKLELLSLRETPVSDEGLSALSGLSNLKHLSLAWTRVTGTGLGALKGLKHLEQLDLSGTQVSAAQAAELKTALPKCEISYPTDPLVIALAEARGNLLMALEEVGQVRLDEKDPQKVRSFNVKHPRFEDAGLEQLAALTAMQKLSLLGTKV